MSLKECGRLAAETNGWEQATLIGGGGDFWNTPLRNICRKYPPPPSKFWEFFLKNGEKRKKLG